MAVHAVHDVAGHGGQRFGGGRRGLVRVNRHPAVGVLHLDPGDLLVVLVLGREGHGVVDDHVPVDARVQAQLGATSARFDHEADLLGGVLLVVPEMGDLHELGAEELLGPVTFLAGLAGGAQVLDGGGDGGLVAVREDRVDLVETRHLGLHVPLGAGTHVALHATHLGVRRVEVGHVLGLHHRVADPPAEGHRFGEDERVVPHEGHENGEQGAAHQDDAEALALIWVIEIQARVRKGLVGSRPAAPQALAAHAVEKEERAEGKHPRENHVGENAQVGARRFEPQFPEHGGDHQGGAEQDDQPAKIARSIAV